MLSVVREMPAKTHVQRAPYRLASEYLFAFVIGLIVAGLVIVPLLAVLISSVSPPEALPFDFKGFTLENFRVVYLEDPLGRLMLNTFEFGAGAMSVAFLLGLFFALLVERTDFPYRSFVYTAMFSAMAFPLIVKVFGWMLALSPRAGFINQIFRNVLPLNIETGPFNIYTLGGMIFVTGVGLAPLSFLLLAGLVRSQDPSLEEAAATAGANVTTQLSRITLPLLVPGLLSVGIYLLMLVIQTLEVPLAIGLTAQLPVLASRLFLLVGGAEGEWPRYGYASALALTMLAVAIVLMLVYFSQTRLARRFEVITGRGYIPRRIKLGGKRYLFLGLVVIYLLLNPGIPLLSVLWVSLSPPYQPFAWATVGKFSLASYRNLLEIAPVQQALLNTGIVTILAATGGVILALLLSWLAVRSGLKHAKWLEVLAFLPLPLPGVVMATAYLLFFAGTPIYGTIWILVVGNMMLSLPYLTRVLSAALLQIHKELEEAGAVAGATRLTILRKIVAPLLLIPLANGWFYTFASTLREFSFAIVLFTNENRVLTSVLWQLWRSEAIVEASALAVLMILVLVVLALPVQILLTRQTR
jgi:iron(III) transport system permease protein